MGCFCLLKQKRTNKKKRANKSMLSEDIERCITIYLGRIRISAQCSNTTVPLGSSGDLISLAVRI